MRRMVFCSQGRFFFFFFMEGENGDGWRDSVEECVKGGQCDFFQLVDGILSMSDNPIMHGVFYYQERIEF